MIPRAVAMPGLAVLMAFGVAACGNGKSSKGNASNVATSAMPGRSAPVEMPAANRAATIPDCGAAQAVWVNLRTRVYHEPGDPAYGKTRHGEYLCPSQAAGQDFRPVGAGGEAKPHRHHAKGESSTM